MTTTTTPKTSKRKDTRNLEWRSNNVGSKLLQKMGWKEGQAVGKRQRTTATSSSSDDNSGNETAPSDNNNYSSSEGIRVFKRQDGLGLGAAADGILAAENHHHVQHFSALLSQLKQEHGSDNDDKKSKKKKKKKSKTSKVILLTNKSTHAKVRQAKFQSKTSEDMKCIFGDVADFPVLGASGKKRKEKKSKKSKSS